MTNNGYLYPLFSCYMIADVRFNYFVQGGDIVTGYNTRVEYFMQWKKNSQHKRQHPNMKRLAKRALGIKQELC